MTALIYAPTAGFIQVMTTCGILNLMQQQVFKIYQRKALLLASIVFMVVITLIWAGRELLLQSRVEQNHLHQQLDIQIQKELLENTIEDNLVMLHGLEAFLSTDEVESLKNPQLTRETTNIAASLHKSSQEVLGVLLVTGSAQQPWTSTFTIQFMDSQHNWASLPDLTTLANRSFTQRKVIIQIISLNNKALLVATKFVIRDSKLWGFVFSFIDFSLVIERFNLLNKTETEHHVAMYIPILNLGNWQIAPPRDAQSAALSNLVNEIILFVKKPTPEQLAVFPIWFALPFILFLSLGSAAFTYFLSFERAKSNWFALSDPLTGISNRRALEQQFTKSNRGNLLLFNIDNFRGINETFGFIIGDQVLLEAVARIQQALSPKDFIARLGNDEFVILPNDPQTSAASQLAQRIQQTMTEPMLINRQMISIVTIVGLSSYPKHGTELSTLVEYADHQQLRESVVDDDDFI